MAGAGRRVDGPGPPEVFVLCTRATCAQARDEVPECVQAACGLAGTVA